MSCALCLCLCLCCVYKSNSASIPDEDWSIELPIHEAQERLSFFINSLAMDSPPAPALSNLQSVSTIVPCYDETIVFSYDELCKPHYYGGKPGAGLRKVCL